MEEDAAARIGVLCVCIRHNPHSMAVVGEVEVRLEDFGYTCK